MNLLIEQRPTAITSNIQQQLSNENDVNNSLSSSPLILKIKRQTNTKQQTDHSSNSSSMANDDNTNNDNNSSRITSQNQRLKRPNTNHTTTRRPSSPAFNGKQQATKRSVTIDNNNNDLNPTNDDMSSKKRFKQDDLNVSLNNKKNQNSFLFFLLFNLNSYFIVFSTMKSNTLKTNKNKRFFFSVFLSNHQQLKWMLALKQSLLVWLLNLINLVPVSLYVSFFLFC